MAVEKAMNSGKYFSITISVFVMLLCSSCNRSLIEVTKRQHRDGYYIVFNTKAGKVNANAIKNPAQSKNAITVNAISEKQTIAWDVESTTCIVKCISSENESFAKNKPEKNIFSMNKRKNISSKLLPAVQKLYHYLIRISPKENGCIYHNSNCYRPISTNNRKKHWTITDAEMVLKEIEHDRSSFLLLQQHPMHNIKPARDIPYALHIFFVVFGILCFISGMILILSPFKFHFAALYGGICMLLFIACWILASQDSIGDDDFE